MKTPLKVGCEICVRVKHWARGGEYGVIREFNSQAKRYLVEFDTTGIGFDDGKFLWLNEVDFEWTSQNSQTLRKQK